MVSSPGWPKRLKWRVHPLFKPKHAVRELFIHLLPGIGIVGIGMVAVVELHDMKPAAINVEVNIALLEIWRDGFPDLPFWINAP